MNANTDQILTTDNKPPAMKKLFFLLTAALFIFGCKDNQSSNTMDQKDSGKTYSFIEKPYGNFEGKDITEYTITNPSGHLSHLQFVLLELKPHLQVCIYQPRFQVHDLRS